MAVTHIEEQFGTLKDLGLTYTLLAGPVPTNHKWNVLVNITNVMAAPCKLQLFVASSSWVGGDGKPTGAKKVAALGHDVDVPVGDIPWVQGIVLLAGQQLVAYSSLAAALDIIACGIDINLAA